MQFPQIRLQQTYAQIGLRITQPVQELQQLPADFSIKQEPATMTIDSKPAELKINQDQAWSEVGYKRISVLSADMADFSRQEGLEAIAAISQEGDQMATIEHKSDALVQIATDKALPTPVDFNIAFIPSYGSVKIQYTPTELHINWKKGGVDIQTTPNRPIHHYTPGKTEVYLRQQQQLQIDFVGGKVDYQTY